MVMKPVDGKPFELTRDTGGLAEGAAAMRAALPGTTLKNVLAQAGRTAVRKGRNAAFNGMNPQPVDWYCFEADDNDTPDWYPQGVACASEAGRAEPVVAVSWYWKPTDGRPEKGVRLSFLDVATRKYAHVLLVRPAPDGSYQPINIHAGGIAWSGDLIYVADTTNGLRVFDVRGLVDLKPTPAKIYLAYRYLMPQVDHWRPVSGQARFSFAAIDRSHSPDALLSGEYAEPGTVGRVARWPLNGDHTLAAGEDGVVRALDAFEMPKNKIQGAQSHEGRWYLSQARDGRTRGSLVVVDTAGKVTTRDFPVGPEDLTCWREKKTLWSVTEFRGRRAVFAVGL
ncbi:hypothetical protein AB0K60_30970 [Thermopolyspora sp. NPDC052614]|uniref:hypothetical protein n=1 Tax=Thermopolyspora sp. NPDC052614 TaxID=3155682 RepID=UPI003439FC74